VEADVNFWHVNISGSKLAAELLVWVALKP
jgi:hypothetical protein